MNSVLARGICVRPAAVVDHQVEGPAGRLVGVDLRLRKSGASICTSAISAACLVGRAISSGSLPRRDQQHLARRGGLITA